MYCASQQSLTTRSGDRMFLKIKWAALVRCSADLIEFTKVKAPLMAIKEGCLSLERSVDVNISGLESYKHTIDRMINELFQKNLESIDGYKTQVEEFFSKRFKEIKDDFFNKGHGNRNSMGSVLLLSQREQSKLFSKAICEIVGVEKRNIPNIFENICKLKVLELCDLFVEEKISVFFPKYPAILSYSIDEQRLSEFKVDETVVFKPESSWCIYPNGDILYTGGEYNNRPNAVCYFITYNRVIRETQVFEPKKRHCLCIFGEDVYCFGGSNEIAQRYVLKTGYWEKLSSSSDIIGSTSACALPQGILIASFKRKELCLYDTTKGTYNWIKTTNFGAPVSKLLIRFKNNVFCLVKNKVFMSDLQAEKWIEVNAIANEENWYSVMEPKVIDRKVYFVLENFKIYAFCVDEYTVEEQKIISN